MSTAHKARKRSRWTGPKRRSVGMETIPARYDEKTLDAATRAREPKGWRNGARTR